MSSSSSSAPPPDPPQEVVVIAPHRDVGETTVRRDDTRDMPGTFGDPTRFAEVMPGVVPAASGLQAFFVRGAPPTATGYFIDGVPVPALYHVGFGPSVIHPGLLDHVDFYQGAPPAQYGRYIGGVLAATTAAPEPAPHGEANLRLFDAGALGETRFDDGKGSALAAARYGYPGLVLPLFAPDTGLSYWDYQARVTHDLGARDRLSAFVFGSYDRLTQVQTPDIGPRYTQQLVADQFHRVDLRWDRALSASATLRLAATLGRDLVGNDAASATDDMVRLRAEMEARPSRNVRVRAGADAQLDALRPAAAPEGSPDPSTVLVPARDAVVTGAHADVSWRVTPAVEITPGLRADVYSTRYPRQVAGLALSGGATAAVDPRLAVRVRVTPGVTTVSTFGVSHQLPSLLAQYPDTTPLIQPGLELGVQSSVQASQGVEVALPAKLSLTSDVFLHDYFGLPDVTACQPTADPNTCVDPSVNGRAYGLELLVRRPFTERFSVWFSYTLSRSTRQARPYFSNLPTMTIASEYDRTHVVSAVASYDFGDGWRAGGRVFAYTGRPYTPLTAGAAGVGPRPEIPYDGARLPGFFRIDARVEKVWRLGERDRIAVVLEGINVTLNKETVDANCGGGPMGGGASGEGAGSSGGGSGGAGGRVGCTFDTVGPISIPSIGVEGTFR